MKKLNLIFIVFLVTILLINKSFGQTYNQDNLLKIVNAYLEFRLKKGNVSKDTDILIIGANSIDKNSFLFEIVFTKGYLINNVKYRELYELQGFKLIIQEENMDKSIMLKKIFKEIPYENLRKEDPKVKVHLSPWRITLNNKNEVLSIETKHPIKDVRKIFKKNKVQFSKKIR